MKSILRVVVVAMFIVTICFATSTAIAKSAHAATRPSTHHLCNSAKYLTDTTYSLFEGSADVLLYYDGCTGSNYAEVILSPYGGQSFSGQAYVERASGPDGGIAQRWSNTCSVSAPSRLACYSPEIYSPNNASQACWLDSGYDNSFCTAFV